MHSIDGSTGRALGESSGGAPRSAPLCGTKLLLALLVFFPAVTGAQMVLRTRLDNDAYNFWQHPAARTDDEYTNGVRLSAELYRAPRWARHLTKGPPNCEVRPAPRSTCVSHELSIEQDIYTPDLRRAPRTVDGWELERPYAAWLYVSSTVRFARPRTQDELELAAGVTGEPALGQLAQGIAHAINERYTREARGWDTQVGFEPGIVLRYRRTWLARAATSRGLGFELQPYAGAAAGNILTNTELGMQARIGFAMSHPWHMPSWDARAPMEFFIVGGARQEVVAHNFSLDGNVIHPKRAVQREPFVGEHTVGFGLRLGHVSLAWRAVTRSREYASGPKHHSYGIMQGGVEIP